MTCLIHRLSRMLRVASLHCLCSHLQMKRTFLIMVMKRHLSPAFMYYLPVAAGNHSVLDSDTLTAFYSVNLLHFPMLEFGSKLKCLAMSFCLRSADCMLKQCTARDISRCLPMNMNLSGPFMQSRRTFLSVVGALWPAVCSF